MKEQDRITKPIKKNFFLNKKLLLLLSHLSLFVSTLFLISHFLSLISQPVSAQLGPQQKNMSVSAVVPPTVADFQFGFQYFGSSLVHQDQTITYEITYGASSSAGLSTQNVIVVNYSNDKAPDGSYLVEYVFGSATKGYGEAQPVVDTQNRTITWTLPPLPEGTMNQKVRFQLRTNGQRHDLQQLTFRSRASMHNEYVTLPDYGVQQNYLFDPALVTPGPPIQDVSQTTPSPTPTPSPLQFYDINLRSLSQSQATISVTTSTPTRKTIRFGTSPTTLTQQMTAVDTALVSVIELANLQPATPYYYQVIATDPAGESIRSDILTFTTAQKSQKLQISHDAFTLTSGDMVLLSGILMDNSEASGFVLLPANTAYKLTYIFAVPPPSNHHEIIVSNDQGILQQVPLTAIDARTYIAQLHTSQLGIYKIEIIQTDDKGNILSRKLSTLKVSPPLRVLEANSSTPIPDARVVLMKYDPATKQFVSVENILFKNPSFTDKEGLLEMILNTGKYRVSVSAFGFREKTAEFTIGPEEGSGYPTISLERDLFNANALLHYLHTLLLDTATYILNAIKSFSTSIRAFTAVSAITLGSFISVGFMFFNIRTDIKWKDFLPFFIYRIAVLRGKHKGKYLFGIVVDKNGKPLGNVRLEFSHINTGVILLHTTSIQSGGFRVVNTFEEPYVKLTATKEDLPPLAMIVAIDTKNSITVKMHDSQQLQRDSFFKGVKHIAGGFFEVVLILSLIMELLFIEAFGVARTLPFIALTFFNLALWIFYKKEKDLHRV